MRFLTVVLYCSFISEDDGIVFSAVGISLSATRSDLLVGENKNVFFDFIISVWFVCQWIDPGAKVIINRFGIGTGDEHHPVFAFLKFNASELLYEFDAEQVKEINCDYTCIVVNPADRMC